MAEFFLVPSSGAGLSTLRTCVGKQTEQLKIARWRGERGHSIDHPPDAQRR
jgi:hypothetical protein